VDVLFLAHRAPFPPDKGDRLRAWRHLQRLAQLGPVDLVAQADSEDEARVAREGLASVCRKVAVFTRNKPLALARTGLALLGGGSLTVAWHTDGRVAAAIEDMQGRHPHDLVWAFSSGTGPWWRKSRAPCRIMDLCDLDALKWEALGDRTRGARGWVYRLEAKRLLPLELSLAAEADLALLSTRQETSDLAARGGAPRRVEVLTNGTPWKDFDGLAPPSAAGPVFGFLGQMDYPPNVAAVVHLAREVMPLVRRTVPDARLVIFGREPTDEVRALAEPDRVEVTGAVDSLPAALERLAVFVAPLDTGRGIPNKILEAMSAGRATVVSSWSAKALTGRPGEDYLVADGASARADAVAGLLADPARADALGAAGRRYVRDAHDWDAVLDRLDTLVRETCRA
jgi:sugar transferase (PEP-CTERM/EpsH1 system associated)